MKRRAFLAATASLAAPAIGRAAGTNTLKFLPLADLNSLDPHITGSDVLAGHSAAVYDMLYSLDESFTPRRQMVEGETTSADGRLWQLTLRPGLRFHDGAPVLARDVVASLKRWAIMDAFGKTLMAATDELSAPSDRVVQFRLKKPFPRLIQALAKFSSPGPFIIPERQALLGIAKPITEVIGSGPYRFRADERVLGSRIVYERFDGYVPRADGVKSFQAGPKVASFDRVEWTIIPDASTAAAALIKGEVDWWDGVTPDLVPLLKGKPGLHVQINDLLGADGGMLFNTLHPPFDNPAIRRAILPAIKQSDFMTAVAGDDHQFWRDRIGVFSAGKPMSTDVGLDVMTGDYAKAKAALIAAGYKGERVVLMQVGDYATLGALGEVAADMLRRIGMNVDVQVVDYGTMAQRRGNKNPPDKGGWSVYFAWYSGMNRFDPASHLTARGDGSYYGWANVPRLRQLRDAWFDAADLAAQQAIARDIQIEMLEAVPFIPLGEYFPSAATRASLGAVGRGIPLFYNVRPG